MEHGLPLKKKPIPQNEDDIRIISLTPFFSKVFEKFVISWLMEYLGKHLDWWQYGGQKGSSVSHYLIDFINFISYNQDMRNIHAVLAVTVDFAKAFNRQNHNILIELLSELGSSWKFTSKGKTLREKVFLVEAPRELFWVCFYSLYLSMLLGSRKRLKILEG